MDDWIDASVRPPREGEAVSLPGIKEKYFVSRYALYNKGKLAIPISIIEKYKIEK